MTDPADDERRVRLTAQGRQLADAILNTAALHALTCPTCQIRFGVDRDELRFIEQTEGTLWCPRGCKLRATITEAS